MQMLLLDVAFDFPRDGGSTQNDGHNPKGTGESLPRFTYTLEEGGAKIVQRTHYPMTPLIHIRHLLGSFATRR
jgi:hypothetical protein